VVRNTAYPLPVDGRGNVISAFSVADLMVLDSAARCATRDASGKEWESNPQLDLAAITSASWPPVFDFWWPPGQFLQRWAVARSNPDWNALVGAGSVSTALEFPVRNVEDYRLLNLGMPGDAKVLEAARADAQAGLAQIEFDLCTAQALNELFLSAAGAQLQPAEAARHLNNIRVYAQRAMTGFAALAEIAGSNDARPADYGARYQGFAPSGQMLYDFTHAPSNEAKLAELGTDMTLAVELHVTATDRLAKLASRHHLAQTAPLGTQRNDGTPGPSLPWGEVLRRLSAGQDPLSVQYAGVGKADLYPRSGLMPTLPFTPGSAFNRKVSRLFELAVQADVFDVLEAELANGSCGAPGSKSVALVYTGVEASLQDPACAPPREPGELDCHARAEALALPSPATDYRSYRLWSAERIAPADAAELLRFACSADFRNIGVPYTRAPLRKTVTRGSILGAPSPALHYEAGGSFATISPEMEHLRVQRDRGEVDNTLPARIDGVPKFGDKYMTTAAAMGLLGSATASETGALTAMAAVRTSLALADATHTAPAAKPFFDNARASLALLREPVGRVAVLRRGLPTVHRYTASAGTFTGDAGPRARALAGVRCVGSACEVLATRTELRDEEGASVAGLPSEPRWRSDEILVSSAEPEDLVLCTAVPAAADALPPTCGQRLAPVASVPQADGTRLLRWTLGGEQTAIVGLARSAAEVLPLLIVPAGRHGVETGSAYIRAPGSDALAGVAFTVDAQAVSASRGGALERLLLRTFAVDARNWTRPLFGMEEPRSLLFPNEGQLLDTGVAATLQLLADARTQAAAAEQRARTAVRELAQQRDDVQAAEDARQRALTVSAAELADLVGNEQGDVPFKVGMGVWGLALKFAPTSSIELKSLTAGSSGLTQNVPYLWGDSLRGCFQGRYEGPLDVIAQKSVDCAESLQDATSGKLKAAAGAYLSSTRAFFEAMRNVVDTVAAANQREAAAAAAFAAAQRIPIGRVNETTPECSAAAFQNALEAGYSFADTSRLKTRVEADGSFEYSDARDGSWSPGPLYQQHNLCDQAAVRSREQETYRDAQAAAASQALLATQRERIAQISAAMSNTNTAAAQVWQAAGQVLDIVGRARTVQAQRDLEVRIASTNKTTRLSFLQRFLSADLETAYVEQERARRLATRARRAIEARYLTDLSSSELTGETLDKKPSTWADSIYSFDFAAIVNQDEARSTNLAAITQYLQRLTDFTQDYQRTYLNSPRVATRRLALPGPDDREVFTGTDGNGSVLPPDSALWSYLCAGQSTWQAHPLLLGTGTTADTMCPGGKPPARLRLRFTLDEWGRLMGTQAPPPEGVFNARFVRAMLTLTPTRGAELPSNATFGFSLVHRGPVSLRDHTGWPMSFGIAPGRVPEARAAIPERLDLSEVNTPWSYSQLQGAIVTSEVADRPLFGTYTIELTLPASTLPSAVGGAQLWVESSSWVKK
jgi:hypothetical protein